MQFSGMVIYLLLLNKCHKGDLGENFIGICGFCYNDLRNSMSGRSQKSAVLVDNEFFFLLSRLFWFEANIMIVTIIVLFYIFILIYLYGMATIYGLSRILRFYSDSVVGFPLILLVGMVTVTVIAMIANLFIPLGVIFFISLLTVALAIAFQKHFFVVVSFPNYRPLTWITFIVVFLIVLENSTHAPSNPDTGLYHAQTIHWFEEYRAVPGLGNLHTRLAFNSSWLVLNASLSLAFLGLQSFHLVGAVLFLSSILYFAEGLDALIRKRLSVAIVLKVLFLPLSFYLFGSEISSPGTDVPVSLITWCILIMWVEMFEFQSRREMQTIVLVLLCIFSITIKLAAIPLLLPAFFVVVAEYFIEKEWRRALLLEWQGRLFCFRG